MDTLPIIGAILIGTVPLIPLFMILIGKQAEKMNQEQWDRMSLLSGHFFRCIARHYHIKGVWSCKGTNTSHQSTV